MTHNTIGSHGRADPVGLIERPAIDPRLFRVVVIGDARVDLVATLRTATFTNLDRDHHEAVSVETRLGGTAVSFALAAVEHFEGVTLLAAIGDDPWTARIQQEFRRLGVATRFEVVPGMPNALVLVVRDAPTPGRPRGTRLLVAQSPSPYDVLDPSLVAGHAREIARADALVVDGYALLAPRSADAVDLATTLAYQDGVPICVDVVPHHIDELVPAARLWPWVRRASLVTVEAPTLARLLGVPLPSRVDEAAVLELVDRLPDDLAGQRRMWFVRFGDGNMDRTVAVTPGHYHVTYSTGYATTPEPTGYGYRVGAAELKWWLLNAATAPGMAALTGPMERSCVRPELLLAHSAEGG